MRVYLQPNQALLRSLSMILTYGILTLIPTENLRANEEGPVCHHCEEIRVYNAKYHQNFEYYDDYLKSQQAGKPQEEERKIPTTFNSPQKQ